MHVIIADKKISRNIRLFLQLLRRVKKMEGEHKAYVHRRTGQILFPELIQDSMTFSPEEWVSLSLCSRFNKETQEVFFEVTDGKDAFRFQDLSPEALSALKQTLQVLNKASHALQGPSDLQTKMQALCKMQIEEGTVAPEHNLIITTWHHADREQAEVLLRGKPVGSFLFRKDPYATILEEQLSEKLRKSVKCVTLTILDPEYKISDYTLAHVDQEWKLYNNDPHLRGPGYKVLEDMIVYLFRDRLKHPIFHEGS